LEKRGLEVLEVREKAVSEEPFKKEVEKEKLLAN